MFPEVNSSVTRISHVCTKDTSPEQSLSGRRAVSGAGDPELRGRLCIALASPGGLPPLPPLPLLPLHLPLRSSTSWSSARGEAPSPGPGDSGVKAVQMASAERRGLYPSLPPLPCPGPGGPLSPGHRKLGCSENALPSTASASGCAWTSHASSTANSLRPHGLQQARLLCPPLSPRVCSNSHILTLLSL